MSEYIPERAMFIAAHPDDLEFGVAATAAKWADHGSDVTFVLITDGNAGSHEAGMTKEKLADIRRQEQRQAADILGVKQVEFLGYDDCQLEPTLELRKKLVKIIRQYRPNAIACMDPTNFFPSDSYINHPDHRAAGQAVIDAVFPAVEMHMLYPDLDEAGYEAYKVNYVYIFFTPSENVNYYVDVSGYVDKKIEALQAHKSQFGDWDPGERIRQWTKESGKRVGFAAAEQYRRITLKEPESEKAEAEAA
ncbi:MAG: PIG-L deacetylase family protein [Chloroflexota bacterium]